MRSLGEVQVTALLDALTLLALVLECYPVELHPQIKEDDYDYRAPSLYWISER